MTIRLLGFVRARAGDTARVKTLIAEGANVNLA